MNPSIRWSIMLMLSLVLWAPTGLAAFSGDIAVDAALLRYVVALLLSWAGVSMVGRLIDTYTIQAQKKADEDARAQAVMNRRRDDEQPAEPRSPLDEQ